MSASYLEAVAELARITGDNALRYYRTQIDVETKADGSPVTIADKSSERLAREWISRKFPRDGIIGEEFEQVNESATRRWIIDPIDGTKAFVRGVPFWGSLVAVADGESVIAGAVSYPALGELLSAAIGEGAWCNDQRCSVSECATLNEATVLTTDATFRGHPDKKAAWDVLAGKASVSRTWGDCYGYLLVATGRAEVMVDPVVNAWDVAAIMPAITESGGVFTDWSGNATAFGKSAIATNAKLASEARQILSGTSQ
jgi:histidinol phosphatase-like enzyme (inositol monophosphatase family)